MANPFKFSKKKRKSNLLFSLSSGLLVGLLVGPSWLLEGPSVELLGRLIFEPSVNIEVANPQATQTPNQGIKSSAKYMLTVGLSGWLIGWLIFEPSVGLIEEMFVGPIEEMIFGLSGGIVGGLASGGDVVTKHCILRLILWWKGFTPWNYTRLLNYCHERIFLRKVGGGYIFIHRMLLEHFAQMTDEDIQRLSTEQ